MSLPESLERAATELPQFADQIRPANGDPHRLLEELGNDEAAKLLIWLLDQATDDASDLVEAWGEDDAGVSILLGVDDHGVSKAGRKLLRKARHRLRSQGIEAASPSAPAPVKKTVVVAGDRWQASHVSSPDFRGARMGYLVDSHPSGGARLFEIRFDEGRGILDFKIYNAGRSKVRGFLKSLTANSGRRLFEVERSALCALVYRAAQAQPTDRPLPTSYIEWRARLFSDDLEQEGTPGDLARTALGDGDLAPALEALSTEIKAGQLGPWPPTTKWVGDWVDKGREAVEGLEGEARGNEIDAWISEVTASLVDETDSALIARHLDELAWVRWQSDEEHAAKQMLAVATALTGDADARSVIARARVESLFEPFLASLRVVEQSPLDESEGGD